MEDNSQERIDSFLKEYGELTKKYEVDFVTYPVYQPNDKGHWDLTLQTTPISTRSKSVKSPFVAQ